MILLENCLNEEKKEQKDGKSDLKTLLRNFIFFFSWKALLNEWIHRESLIHSII